MLGDLILAKVVFSPLSDLLPSRDAVDDRFQRTLDVLTGITMG